MTNLLNSQSIKNLIEKKISEIEKLYQEHNGLILTEDDLKCHTFIKLLEIEEFSGFHHKMSDKGVSGSKIHAELSWYDKDEKLSIKPDLSIIEPRGLSIYRSITGGRLPSKQYSFGGNSIIFEIKFCRYKSGITANYFQRQIKKDFEKINRLFAKLDGDGFRYSIFCFFIVFNKTNKTCREFREFLNKNIEGNRFKIIYKTGNIDLTSNHTM